MANAPMYVLVITLLLQASGSPGVLRVGPTGDWLRETDLAQIARLFPELSEAPWLMVGRGRPFEPHPIWFVDVFFPPRPVNEGVRRGHAETVVAFLTSWDGFDEPKTWRRESAFDYAQVPVDGRDPDIVTGSRDFHRPFRMSGEIEDAALVAIVSAVRRSPVFPPPPRARPWEPLSVLWTHVQGSWPIQSVAANSDGTVDVWLRYNVQESGGQIVRARPSGRGWQLEIGGAFTHGE